MPTETDEGDEVLSFMIFHAATVETDRYLNIILM